MTQLASQSEFARLEGVDKGHISRLKGAGRLVMVDGKVDVAASRARIAATSHPSYASKLATGAAQTAPHAAQTEKTHQPPNLDDAMPLEADLSGMGGERRRYKELLLHFENGQLKLEMALRRHLRYPADEVKAEALGYGAIVRAAFERLIDQTAPRLAAAKTEDRPAIVRRELARLRNLVRREPVRALRRMRKGANT